MRLDEEAIKAVRKWQFKPGEKDGHPVTVAATIQIHFRLREDVPVRFHPDRRARLQRSMAITSWSGIDWIVRPIIPLVSVMCGIWPLTSK